MLTLITGWAVIATVILAVALVAPPRSVLTSWVIFAAIITALAGLAIARQPLGESTAAGRLGSAVVRWGFRAGHGRLLPALLISWLVWVLLGATVILIIRHRGDTQHALLLLAWAVDAAALFYTVGVILANWGGGRSFTGSLVTIAGVLVTMIVASVVLWSAGGSPGARRAALLVAGGPPLFIGVGYGLFVLVTLTVGHGRWN
jgi:hypothetical protein